MQVITTRQPGLRRASLPLFGATLLGLLLVGGGLALAYLAFGTSLMGRFAAPARPTAGEAVAAALAWAIVLVAPALFIIVGLARLAGVMADLAYLRRRPGQAARVADRLPADHVAAMRVRLPDGRIVPELVVGPFGAAVLADLPPPAATRQRDGRWEAHLADGRWVPMENPLERAARDAERVRRWLSHEDTDHLVKVHAAMIAPDVSIPRTPACAVVTIDQLPAWLASLPPQRGLSTARRDRLVELIRASV